MREIIIGGLTIDDCRIAKKCLEGKTRLKLELEYSANEYDYSLCIRTRVKSAKIRELYQIVIQFLIKVETNSYVGLELYEDEPAQIMAPRTVRPKCRRHN